MARDLAAEIEAELEAVHGVEAEFVGFVGDQYDRVRYRLGDEARERVCGWCLDDGDEVELDVDEGATVMRQQARPARLAALGGERIKGTHSGTFARLVQHIEALKRHDLDAALLMQDYVSMASMAIERAPGPAAAPATMAAPRYSDMDFAPGPVVDPWSRPAAPQRHQGAALSSDDYAPCPVSPWG